MHHSFEQVRCSCRVRSGAGAFTFTYVVQSLHSAPRGCYRFSETNMVTQLWVKLNLMEFVDHAM